MDNDKDKGSDDTSEIDDETDNVNVDLNNETSSIGVNIQNASSSQSSSSVKRQLDELDTDKDAKKIKPNEKKLENEDSKPSTSSNVLNIDTSAMPSTSKATSATPSSSGNSDVPENPSTLRSAGMNSEAVPGPSTSAADDTTAEQFGDFVSMIMNHLPDESSIISGPSDQNNIDSLPDLANFPSVRARTARQPEQGVETASTIHAYLTEAKSLLTYYQCCLRLIEASTREDFQHWDWLDECLAKMSDHPRVSDKMKLRYYLHNKNNAKTFRVIQKNLKLDLDNQFYMGKMNLLHIACDSGWPDLVKELVHGEKMAVNLVCPCRHMKPGNLTPLMLASGAGHSDVVKVLLERDDINIDQKDSEGFTALFHACNHGSNRVGDKHGYFRRLWSWDLSGEQILSMERIARLHSREILRLLISHGSDVMSKDNTGATVLYRACTVDNFGETIQFLVEVGCRVTHNILNWIRVKNPDCVERIEIELCTPKTLARQARLAVWSCLRRANKIRNFATITEALSEANQPNNGNEIYIPNILVDYLNCK